MIYLASDHRGFELKGKIVQWLTEWGMEYRDLGPDTHDPADDYPDFVTKVGNAITAGTHEDRGIVLGFSGQGEAIVANKHKGVRAVVFCNQPDALPTEDGKISDPITLMREDDNANVLAIGAGFVDDATAKTIIKKWLETPFTGAERHKRRVDKVTIIEEANFV